MNAKVVVGAQGRLVIPAEMRHRLHLEAGEELSVRLEGTQLVLQRPADALEEIKRIVQQKAKGRSLVDELIAERRREALSDS